jgi:hypothetical protein
VPEPRRKRPLEIMKKKNSKKPIQRKTSSIVKFHFDNKVAAKHFIDWLCGSGEQQYWDWMQCREEEEGTKDITAVNFNYWHDETEFAKNLEVVAKCGRLDDDIE